MARPAVERLQALIAALGPAPGRLEFAARLALVCALTTLLTQAYETPSPAFTAYCAFFLNKPDRTASIVQCIVMTLVITVVVGFTLLVAAAVVDSPAWRVASMAVISFGLVFLGSASKLRPIAGPFAIIVAYALDLLGTVPGGEIATRGLLYVWLMVAIPAGVSVVVSLLLAPSPRQLVQRALAARLHLAAALLRGTDPRAAGQLERVRRAGDGEIASGLKLAAMERTSSAQDLAALRQAADASIALLFAAELMTSHAEAMPSEPLRGALARTLDDMAGILARGGYPVNIEPPTARDEPVGPLAAAALSAMTSAMARFAEPTAPSPAAPPAAASGFLSPDAFTNPAHVRHALKTTAAAMFCYIVYSLLDWPGIHTCLITCYIVSLGALGDSVEKLTLRIAGCLAGAALGIGAMVFVVPAFTSIGSLIAVVFAGALVAAWVAAGSPRVSYAGFQIAFAFFLCVVQGTGPSFDLTVARDRIIGILFGNAVVYVMATHVWPVSVRGRIEAGFAAALRRLGLMAREADPARRRRLAAQAQAAIGAVQDDLDIGGYETGDLRPEPAWLDARRREAARAADLGALMLVVAEARGGTDEDTARRLERLAGEVPVQVPQPAAADGEPDALRAMVRARLRSLEHAIGDIEGRPRAMA